MIDEIQPLDASVFNLVEGKADGKNIPIIGWMISRRLYRPVKESISRTLESRPIINTAIWGDDRHQEIAQFLCSKIKAEIGWPNDRFIPVDTIDVVLWMCDDDLEIVEIIMDIEDRYKIKIADDFVGGIVQGTMGNFVKLIASLMSAEAPESLPASPSPS